MISVTSELYQGQESWRIALPAVTYLYHQEGCGFAALFDADGNDWISYRPSGGEYGHYRGIPNMGYNAFGHPGYDRGAQSTLTQVSPAHVRITSVSADGAWRCRWDLHPEGAVQTVEATPVPYWWLYEGTPGGHFRPQENYRLLPGGERLPCDVRDYRPAASPRWIGFGDPACAPTAAVGRLLLLCAHTPEAVIDAYWPMGGEGGMTVFGFGREERGGLKPHLTATPAHFSFALLETEDLAAATERYTQLDALTRAGDPA